MRKIMTAEEIERKRQRRGRMLAAFMLIILLGSTAGYAFTMYGSDKSEKGDTDIVESGNGWIINYNGESIFVQTSPEEVKDVQISTIRTLEDYYGQDVYISSGNDEVTYELASVLERRANRVQKACYGKCDLDLPEKNCSSNLIVWEKSEEESVREEEGCVFIKGSIKAADAFIYSLLGR